MKECQKYGLVCLACGFVAGLAIGSVVYGKRGRRYNG